MNLFQLGDFTLASGAKSPWKIDCDALSEGDWAALAAMAAERLPPFGSAWGVPRGGLPFAQALQRHRALGCETALIAEDVVTTGGSMERYLEALRRDPQVVFPRDCIGVCVFARGPCPGWVYPLFRLGPTKAEWRG